MTTSTRPDNIREEIAALTRPDTPWRTVPMDAIVLLALLIGANWFFSQSDPGWQRLNPTPWLLLPFFLGGRHGAAAGLVGALLAAAGVLGLQWALGNMSPQALFSAKPYYFLALLIAGAVGAIVHRLVWGPAERLRRQAITLAERNQSLEEGRALYRANDSRLQESLLLHGAETISLTTELQRLFADQHGRFEEGLLALFTREFGVISAAIYRDDTGRHRSLSRIATTGTGDLVFPPVLPDPGATLAEAALESGEIATWKSTWDGGVPSTTGRDEMSRAHLAAIPWQMNAASRTGPRALLLISRMEFGSIRWETLSRIEAIFRWTLSRMEPAELEHADPAGGRGPILPRQEFSHQIELAHRLETNHGLPGQLVLFAADPNAEPSVLAAFVESLRQVVPPGDKIGAVGDGQTIPLAIGVISPAPSTSAAESTARQWVERIGDAGRAVRFRVFSLEEARRIVSEPKNPRPSAETGAIQAHAAAPAPGNATAEDAATPVAAD